MIDKKNKKVEYQNNCWTNHITSLVFFLLPTLILLSFYGQVNAQEIKLDNLNSFQSPVEGWEVQGDVLVNPLNKGSFNIQEGSGVLVGSASQKSENPSLKTRMTHGDVALEFDVLLSHGASAILFLQGRYGIRLVDSWEDGKLDLLGNGVIIPPGKKGGKAAGYLPDMNVARAPGTWQHIKIVFDAPRFDENKQRVRPARIVSFEENGRVIQENQYMAAPSNGAPYIKEQSEGPLAFQALKGHIAIKNIDVTKYTGEKVQLEDLSYRLFMEAFLDDEFIYWGGGPGDHIPLPNVAKTQPDQQGAIENIETRMVRGKDNDFALVFDGKMNIPKSGKYQFEIVPNGIGSFELDNEELTRWDALHNKGSTSFTTELKEGTHDFKQLYINYGQPRAGLYITGPGIKRHALHEGGDIPEGNTTEPIVLKPGKEPLIQRSFLHYDNQKLLTCMNVGSPKGIHYAYNMATGGLVQVWRGGFGDVTEMWHGRGAQQVLKPLGSVLLLDEELQLLVGKDIAEAKVNTGGYRRIGYDLNSRSEPIFEYTIESIRVRDHIQTENLHPTIKRSIRFTNSSQEVQKAWYRLATSSNIKKVSEKLYAIDNKSYFIELGDNRTAEIQTDGEEEVLLVPLQIGAEPQHLTYSVLW